MGQARKTYSTYRDAIQGRFNDKDTESLQAHRLMYLRDRISGKKKNINEG